MADAPSSSAGDGGEVLVREPERFLPVTNISRIMKKALPPNGKMGKDTKNIVQECVSEFVSFGTGEAMEKCQSEKRKTINGDDLLWSMVTLGFNDYLEPLKIYLAKYRELEGDNKGSGKSGDGSNIDPGGGDISIYDIPGNIEISVVIFELIEDLIKNRIRTMDSQEASSRARVKVDFVQPMVIDKERKLKHRKSLAWDSAFFTNPGVLDPEELFGNLKIGENETEPKHCNHSSKTRPCVSFPRPSFAWDNAFLTAPGVLDAEELSLVNNGFTSNTEFPKSADSMMAPKTTQGNRFSVSSIESDLFHDLRASIRSSTPNVKQTVSGKIQPKLPDGKKRIKGSNKKEQPMSLIPQSKIMPSSSFSSSFISKPSTPPTQANPEKKCVASELGRNRVNHKNHGFAEHSGSKSITRSLNSRCAMKDLTTSFSGLKLPRPKLGFFDSENGEKENREPNTAQATVANRGRRYKSKLETSSPPESRSVLGQRKTRK